MTKKEIKEKTNKLRLILVELSVDYYNHYSEEDIGKFTEAAVLLNEIDKIYINTL